MFFWYTSTLPKIKRPLEIDRYNLPEKRNFLNSDLLFCNMLKEHCYLNSQPAHKGKLFSSGPSHKNMGTGNEEL